jgi:hypothetical protein
MKENPMIPEPNRKNVILKALATIFVLTLAFSVGVSATAMAAPVPEWAGPTSVQQATSASSDLAANVQKIVELNAGSHQVSADTVQLGPGAFMTVSAASVSGTCATGWLCLYQHANFGGYALRFTVCRLENLGNYVMPNGQRWNDQVSSIDNPQTGGVVSRFYNYKGSGDPMNLANSNPVIAVTAGHYLRDLSKDSSFDGGTANDKIDIVRVC